jgi:outer membrane protein TolC
MEALKANFEQAQVNARMQWRLASAELARVLRLSPTVVVQPLEPPNLQVTLVPPVRTPEDMIPLALSLRPELSSYQAQVAAAEKRLQQERFRPLLPTIVVRGNSTPTPYPLGVVDFAAGPGGNLVNNGIRSDWDLEAIWEFKNLGFGNLALIRQKSASLDIVRNQEYRFRDIVAKEITQQWVVLRAAEQRTGQSERELQKAWLSASKQLQVLGETNRVAGNVNILVIRPQEVSSAMQALVQAYYNYYGSVADFNRAQFRLYRALGNPAQQLHDHEGIFAVPSGCK